MGVNGQVVQQRRNESPEEEEEGNDNTDDGDAEEAEEESTLLKIGPLVLACAHTLEMLLSNHFQFALPQSKA